MALFWLIWWVTFGRLLIGVISFLLWWLGKWERKKCRHFAGDVADSTRAPFGRPSCSPANQIFPLKGVREKFFPASTLFGVDFFFCYLGLMLCRGCLFLNSMVFIDFLKFLDNICIFLLKQRKFNCFFNFLRNILFLRDQEFHFFYSQSESLENQYFGYMIN